MDQPVGEGGSSGASSCPSVANLPNLLGQLSGSPTRAVSWCAASLQLHTEQSAVQTLPEVIQNTQEHINKEGNQGQPLLQQPPHHPLLPLHCNPLPDNLSNVPEKATTWACLPSNALTWYGSLQHLTRHMPDSIGHPAKPAPAFSN